MNFRLIAEQWDRIGQFYAAFPAGHATASAALQRLNRFQASNRFYAANRELGRALKTEFVLQYTSEPQLRAKVRRALLKVEQLHALVRAVHYGQRGTSARLADRAAPAPLERRSRREVHERHESRTGWRVATPPSSASGTRWFSWARLRNVAVRRDGLPYARQRTPEDPAFPRHRSSLSGRGPGSPGAATLSSLRRAPRRRPVARFRCTCPCGTPRSASPLTGRPAAPACSHSRPRKHPPRQEDGRLTGC